MNQLISYKAVYRTAPATRGLLNSSWPRPAGLAGVAGAVLQILWYFKILSQNILILKSGHKDHKNSLNISGLNKF